MLSFFHPFPCLNTKVNNLQHALLSIRWPSVAPCSPGQISRASRICFCQTSQSPKWAISTNDHCVQLNLTERKRLLILSENGMHTVCSNVPCSFHVAVLMNSHCRPTFCKGFKASLWHQEVDLPGVSSDKWLTGYMRWKVTRFHHSMNRAKVLLCSGRIARTNQPKNHTNHQLRCDEHGALIETVFLLFLARQLSRRLN